MPENTSSLQEEDLVEESGGDLKLAMAMERNELENTDAKIEAVEEEEQELLLRSKSKDVTISVRYLYKEGARELDLLKTTALLNINGSVKPYAKTSLNLLEIGTPIRDKILKLVSSK